MASRAAAVASARQTLRAVASRVPISGFRCVVFDDDAVAADSVAAAAAAADHCAFAGGGKGLVAVLARVCPASTLKLNRTALTQFACVRDFLFFCF